MIFSKTNSNKNNQKNFNAFIFGLIFFLFFPIGKIQAWTCGDDMAITHTAGAVAPVSKSVTYKTALTNLSGSNKCWITQNLGATNPASSATDSTEASAGWYWQFNRTQGYKHDGSTRTPSGSWTTQISENSNWLSANDPCALLLGTGWRLPTATELSNADSTGGWNNRDNAYASVLKFHAAGYLWSSSGGLDQRGSQGRSRNSTQYDNGNGNILAFDSGSCAMSTDDNKASGQTVRCLADVYTLTYAAGSNGSISGTSPQTVISNGSGTAVTANPSTGYHFVNWSDSSTQNPRTDTNVTANKSVTANFAINTYTLTYTAGSNGSISGTSPQTVNYGASGSAVTANPSAHYHFVNWSDSSTQNPRTDTNVGANITVTANFAIDTYTLTYTAGSGGSISGTSPQTVSYGSSGSAVTANPNTGYHFVNWSDSSTQNPRTDTNVTANISVTANFAINTYTLTYNAGSNGSISGTSPQTVNYGASGSAVTAVPNAHYHFVNWSDSSTQNPRTDTNVTANISVTANFAIDTFTLTYTAGSHGSISGTSPQTVNYNASGSAVTAIPDTECHFIDWSDSSTQNPRTDTNVAANISVTANFAINTYTVSFDKNGGDTEANPTSRTVDYNTTVTLPTQPTKTGYTFSSWNTQADGNGTTFTGGTPVIANITVYAQWTINTYTLTYTAGSHGSISGTSPQTVNYNASGSAVTAVPSAHYHFVNWSDGSTQNPRTDTNVSANVSVTANFTIDTFTLTYMAGSHGAVSGINPQTIDYEADGSAVTANPDTGYHFVNWSDESTDNPRTDTNITTDISVTANFAINTYTLTYTAGAHGSISGTSPQTVNHGSNGSAVTANSDTSYHFVNWSDESTQNPRTDTNVTTNLSFTASFAENPNVILSYNLSRPVSDPDTLRVVATFDKEVRDDPIPQIAIAYTGGGALSATNMTKTDTTHYYYDVNVPAGSDGSASVTISNAQDLDGSFNNPASNNTFTVDNTKPLLPSLTLSDPTPTKAGDITFTLNFNEPMDTGTNPTVTFGTSSPYNQHTVSTSPTWTNNQTFTAHVTIPNDGTWDGSNTIKISGAKDMAGNTMLDNSTNTFVIDTVNPSSDVSIPEDSGEYWDLPAISGTASDTNSVASVYISIKNTTDGSHFWSGSDWSITDENASWLPVTTGTISWSYNASAAHVTWTVNSSYLIRSKSIDVAGNAEVPGTGNEFTFINAHPVISNLVAVQKNDGESNAGKVAVSYDVTDLESSETTVSLFYDSGATLAVAIPDNSSTNQIQTTDGTHFPNAGTILIKKGTGETAQYEYISYSGKSGNNLTGISRSQEGTVGANHLLGEQIWIRATTLSGGYGTQENGTGKAILWDAQVDTARYDDSMVVRVAAFDGASSNNIGISDSATFEFDTKTPVVNSASVDASLAVANNSSYPATLNFNVSDDTAKQMQISLDSGFSGAAWIAYAAHPTITLETDPDTVYVKFKDTKGNLSATSTLTTPERPDKFMVQDISNFRITSPETRLFVAWKTVAEPVPGFSSYSIYRTENGTDWDLRYPVTARKTNYYEEDDVVADTAYTYRVVTVDQSDNRSFSSTSLDCNANGTQDVDEGGGGVGNQAPNISNVVSSIITSTSAIITWDTDSLSNSTVGYSTSAAVFTTERGVNTMKDNNSHIGNHSVTLSGLTPGATYHYQVKSVDALNSLATDNSGGAGYTFTTGAGDTAPPTISAITVANTTASTATITWNTDESATSYIEYSKTDNFTQGAQYGNDTLTQTHSITVPSLESDAVYYFKVHSQDVVSNEGISDQATFTTATLGDVTPPNISNIIATPQPTYATITWSTNENATSYVEYGLTTSYGRMYGNSSQTQTHSVNLPSDLVYSTQYHFKVHSADSSGNEAISDDTTFTTNGNPNDTTSPTISNVVVGTPATDRVTLTWTTNEDATTYVEYSLDSNTFYAQGSRMLTQNHSATVIGLTPGTPYYLRIVSADAVNNTRVDNNNSGYYLISTDTGPQAPIITELTVAGVSGTQATITWETDTSADSFVEYGLTTDYGETVGKNDSVQSHSINVKNLVSPAIYHFRVRSRNSSETVSGDNTLATIADVTGATISNMAVAGINSHGATIGWSTGENTNTIIHYGTTTSYAEIAGNRTATIQSHSVVLSTLTPATEYHYQIISQDVAGNVSQSADQNFTTLTDTTNPVISNIIVQALTQNTTLITWDTDKETNTKVNYGIDHNLGNSLTSSLFGRTHYLKLSGLTATTPYYFKVTATDAYSNSNLSAENSFTTETNPRPDQIPLTEITDIADPPSVITDTKAVATFNTDQPAKCVIEYGTQTGTYSEVPFAETDYNQNHSIHLTGLISETKYYYQITCEDELETVISSTEHSFTTSEADTIGDTTAPGISSVGSGSITGESVTISWKTDENANSLLEYGITTDYMDMAGNSLINFDKTKYTTDHSVIVNNLTPGTKYYYKVLSTDFSGNIAESGEETFTTKAPSSLSSIKFTSTSLSEVVASWNTSTNMTSEVEYGLTTEYGEVKASSTKTKEHSLNISSLKSATLYHFRIKGQDADNNLFSSGDYTFEPKSPPKVDSIKVVSVSEHSAKLKVNTDIPADVLVTYFEKGNPTNSGSQGKPDFTTSHELELSNLNSGTTYRYTVKVSDEEGNQATSEEKEFTTEKDETAPEITQIKTDGAITQNDKVQMIISWTTNEPATTVLNYQEGAKGEQNEILVSDAYTQSHIVVSTIFKSGTVYHFKVKSVDEAGNEAISKDYALLTPRKKENIVQIIVNNFQDIFGWAKMGGGRIRGLMLV